MPSTAILVDGGFYRARSRRLWGDATPEERAKELYDYCLKHVSTPQDPAIEGEARTLYRIFYYDCPPVKAATVWHPLLQKQVHFSPRDEPYKWATAFLDELAGHAQSGVATISGTV